GLSFRDGSSSDRKLRWAGDPSRVTSPLERYNKESESLVSSCRRWDRCCHYPAGARLLKGTCKLPTPDVELHSQERKRAHRLYADFRQQVPGNWPPSVP